MASIATFTINPTVDKSCSVDRVVAEHKLRCHDVIFDPGGGGVNVARVVHKLGGDCLALWTRGGPVGDLLAQLLDAEQLPHRAIPIEQMTRQNLIVFEEASTQQYRFGMPGPEMTDAEAVRCMDTIQSLSPVPEYLVLSGSLPGGVSDDFYAQATSRFHNRQRVIVDTSGPALRKAVSEGCFLIKPNLRELGQLVGRELETDREIREAAQNMIAEGKVEVVVVSLGGGGALLITAEGVADIRTPTVPIRSKVGAGDSMVAGIVHSLAQGREIGAAVRFGVAAGAAAVMTPATQLCTREDTERLYQQMIEGEA